MPELKYLKYLKMKVSVAKDGEIITLTSEQPTPVEVGDTIAVEYTKATVVEVLDEGKTIKGKIDGQHWLSGVSPVTAYAISKEQKYGQLDNPDRLKDAEKILEEMFDDFYFEEYVDGKLILKKCKFRIDGGNKSIHFDDYFTMINNTTLTFLRE